MTNEQKPAAADVVARLRDKADMIELGEKIAWGSDSAIMREAEAEITALRRTRDDLHVANNAYLDRARSAEAFGAKGVKAVESMIGMTEEKAADIGELVKRIEYAVGNPSAWEAYDEGKSEMLREAARALAVLEARCAELEDELTETSQHWPDWAKQIYKFMRGLGYYEGSVDEVHLPDDLEEWFEEAVSSEVSRRDRIEREPVVKALEWRKPTDHPQDYEDAVAVAAGIGGMYSITEESDHFLLWDAGDNFTWTQYPSIPTAKAAAQADYERRILSALASAPERVEAITVDSTELQEQRDWQRAHIILEAQHRELQSRAIRLQDELDALRASPPAPVVTDQTVRAARDFMQLFNREDALSVDDIDHNELAQKYAALEAALASREAT